nr:hypothetical protein [Phascolarctobacterium succinatutens]
MLTILLTWVPAVEMQGAGLWLAERRQKLKQTQTALPADFCDRACRNKIIIKIRADFGEVRKLALYKVFMIYILKAQTLVGIFIYKTRIN